MMSRPDILIIPTHGLCNRLRAIASGVILAKLYGTRCFVKWLPQDCCNCSLLDILEAVPYPDIDLDIVKQKKYFFNDTLHTETVLSSGKDEGIDFLVVKGGHEFKHPRQSQEDFLTEKKAFYASIPFKKRLISQVDNLQVNSSCIGIHFRDFIPTFDTSDNYHFEDISPLTEYIAVMLEILHRNPSKKFYLSTNSKECAKEILQVIPRKHLIFQENKNNSRSELAGIEHAILDLLAMSRCGLLFGSERSSFSDEAAIMGNIVKVCVNKENSEKSYHCYGSHLILSDTCRVITSNPNDVVDIIKRVIKT